MKSNTYNMCRILYMRIFAELGRSINLPPEFNFGFDYHIASEINDVSF